MRAIAGSNHELFVPGEEDRAAAARRGVERTAVAMPLDRVEQVAAAGCRVQLALELHNARVALHLHRLGGDYGRRLALSSATALLLARDEQWRRRADRLASPCAPIPATIRIVGAHGAHGIVRTLR